MNSRVAAVGSFVLLLVAGSVSGQSPPKRSTVYGGVAGQKVEFPAGVFAPNASLTVEAWVYREDETRCETIISQDYTRSLWFGFCSGRLRFYRSGGQFADADRNVPKHRWTHVAASYNATNASGTVQFYIDGVPAGVRPLANGGAGHNLNLDIGSDPGGYLFQGAIDEIRLWSQARSQAQIEANRFVEIASATNLSAAFPQGGSFEAVSNRSATTVMGAAQQVLGILPRDLVVPVVVVSPVVDGYQYDTEYGGAEEMPFRYLDGTNEVDTVAKIVGWNAGGGPNNRIFVGVSGLQTASGFLPNAHVAAAWGPWPLARTAPGFTDFRLTGYYLDGSIATERGDTLSGFSASSVPSPSGATLAFCNGEFIPACIEFGTYYVDRTSGAGLMLRDWRLDKPSNVYDYSAPFDANPNDPSTWARVSFGSAIGSAASVDVTVTVAEPIPLGAPNAPLAGATVVLRSGNFGPVVDQRVTDASGQVHLTALVVTNVPIQVQIELPSGWRYLGVQTSPGLQPTSTNASSALFPACANRCTYAALTFLANALPTNGMSLTGVFPGTAWPRLRLRDSPLKELPPSVVEILGANFHAQMRVWLSSCGVVPTSPVGNPWDSTLCAQSEFAALPVLGVSADRTRLYVSMEPPASWYNSTRNLLVQDPVSHPGVVPWGYVPGGVVVGLPPYPMIHGFEFTNERDGTQFDEFSGVFTWHAYDCASIIPLPPVQTCPGCRVPDPVYLTYYSLVFTPWVELMTGSCLGMSSTSLLFARGDLTPSTFGTGVYYANGLAGVADSDPGNPTLHPPKPQQHQFRPCDYSQPVNLWAHIHLNQAIQATSEFLTSILGQMHGTGIAGGESIDGDPVTVLGRIRGGLRSYLLAFNQSGDLGKAHVVVPYGIIDGKGIADDGFTLVDRSNSSVIQVYDSNWPGFTNRFFEIDRVANTYRYVFDVLTTGPDLWHGTGAYAVPLSIFQQTRTAPGLDILARGLALLVFGSGDGLFTDSNGGQWGWDASGAQHDTFVGARSIAPLTGDFPYANTNHGVFFFPPTNSPPSKIQINTRGKDYSFFGGEAGTLCFLTVSGTVPGEADQITLGQDGDRLGSFRFTPQKTRTSFTPYIGLAPAGGASVVFGWEGMALSGGQSVELAAHRDSAGVELRNDDVVALQPVLRILTASATGMVTNHVGPFTIPAGATWSTAMPDWPNSTAVLSQVDLNRDGVPESVSVIAPDVPDSGLPPVLAVGLAGGSVALSWAVSSAAYSLEQTSQLTPGAAWTAVSALPTIAGNQASVQLPQSQKQSFFRLRRLP